MAFQLPIDQPFDLERTLRCGQGHRWRKDKKNPGWYNTVFNMGDAYSISTGRGKHELVWICQINGVDGLVEFGTDGDINWIRDKLCRQFRLDDDITEVYRRLGSTDRTIDALVTAYHGLRVMRVDLLECLVFFALARVKDIRQTHVCMDRLADHFGDKVTSDNCERNTFPDASTLVDAGLSALEGLKLGVPSIPPTILALSQLVLQQGVNSLIDTPYTKLVQNLTSMDQVADKSANCVALFSLDHLNAFPVDSHIREASESLYGETPMFPAQSPKKTYDGRILDWAQTKFDPYAGYASQFLFMHDYEGEYRR